VVLAVLATRPGHPVTPDRIADALWGQTPPPTAGKVLQGCIARLRKGLGREAIETSAQGYALTLSSDEIDSMQFERLVGRGRELLTLGEADRAAYLLEQALSLWRGDAFADLEAWAPAADEAKRLGELRLEAQELRVDAHLRVGHHDEVLAQAQALVRAAPLRERRWSLLALAQYRSGAQGEALRTIHQLKSVLARQLGIDASPEVMALEQAILRQDASLLTGPALAPASATCPWQGLQPYGEGDADRFFGRGSDVDACLEILRRTSLLVLVGPSGCGKSSLLQAGVGATLRGRNRTTVSITPGTHPMQAITALGQARPETVLVVDQFEELFSLCADLEERQEFLEALTEEAAAGRTVAVALRADHLADLASSPAFSRLVERGLYLVGGLEDRSLREAIEGPARQAGLVIEPGLVDVLVREVKDDPGALPLLSHALLETWKRREGNTLTVAGYRATGGIHDAVAQSAERLYARIEVDQRQLLRDLVLRLVSPGAQGEPVRSRVPRRLIANDTEHDQLIELLIGARLVTSDDGVLEITHEALARAWPRLRGWLDDDVEGQRMLHHLSSSADAWDTLGRPDSELYRGIRLARVLDWQQLGRTALTDTEREFLDLSRHAAEAEERTVAERARVQARLIRRLRIVLGGAAVLLVLALVAGILAAVQSNRANENAAHAEQLAVSADARRVGARSQLTEDISLSLLLAAAGARLDDSPETRANLLTALAKRPTLVRSAPPEGGYLEAMDVSRDGRWIASGDDQNRMHLYDASTNRLLRSYDAGRPAEDGQAFTIGAFSPDSSQLAVILTVGDSTEPVRLLDPDTMQPTTKLAFPGGERGVGVEVQFSADGRYLAATVVTGFEASQGAETRAYAVVWDVRSLSTPPVRIPISNRRQGLALSPDGHTVYTGRPLTAYDVASGTRVWHRPEVNSFSLDLNSQGTLLALQIYSDVGTHEDPLLVDPATGETVHKLRGHQDVVSDVRFSPDGSLVGSVAIDGELIVWDTATGQPLERWQTFDPWGVGFSPDNNLVYGGGSDSTMLRTWDLSQGDTYLQQTTQVGDAEVYAQADLSPDGEQVAYRWLDDTGKGWVRFVDTATGERTPPTRLPAVDDPWSWGTWHPDGGRYVGWCAMDPCQEHGVVTVLDPTTGKTIQKQDIVDGGRDGDVWGVAYVDQGRSLLVGEWEHTFVVDAETLRPRGEPFDMPGHYITPIGDGSTAMVHETSLDLLSEHWRVIDVSTGEVRSEGEVDVIAAAADASPDGSTEAIAGDSGEIITFDVSTGDEQRRSAGLGAPVYWLDYSDDGELLVSGADDGGVSLWDAATLDLLGTVYPHHHGEPVPAGAQFIGDSHDVAIASYDGRVYQWETDLDRAIDFACQMAGRNLTEEEWAEFLPAQPYQSVCPDE